MQRKTPWELLVKQKKTIQFYLRVGHFYHYFIQSLLHFVTMLYQSQKSALNIYLKNKYFAQSSQIFSPQVTLTCIPIFRTNQYVGWSINKDFKISVFSSQTLQVLQIFREGLQKGRGFILFFFFQKFKP